MNINFAKLVVLLLPTFLRHTKLAYFIEACIEPAKRMYNELVAWNEEKKLEIATTCQICYLEAYLNYKLLNTFERKIMIQDGLGTDVDFHVVVPSSVNIDTYRLEAIVDKFKLIGKRYDVVGGSVSYSFAWQNFLQEIVVATNAGVWQNFLQEIVQGVKKELTIALEVTKNYQNGYCRVYQRAYVVTGDTVTSDVSVTIHMHLASTNEYVDKDLTILAGNNSSGTFDSPWFQNGTTQLTAIWTDADEDTDYTNSYDDSCVYHIDKTTHTITI